MRMEKAAKNNLSGLINFCRLQVVARINEGHTFRTGSNPASGSEQTTLSVDRRFASALVELMELVLERTQVLERTLALVLERILVPVLERILEPARRLVLPLLELQLLVPTLSEQELTSLEHASLEHAL